MPVVEPSRSIYVKWPDLARDGRRSSHESGPASRRRVVTTAFVSTWFGAFLVEDGRVTRAIPAPLDAAALAERTARRRSGALTPEEEELLRARGSADWVTRDRRLAEHGVRFDPRSDAAIDAVASGVDPTLQRTHMLADAERALEAQWDPSVHVQEAVRAAADLDRVRNLIGERLGTWVSRDRPEVDPGDHDRAAREAMAPSSPSNLAPQDPSLTEARRKLAELFRAVEGARHSLTKAIEATAPVRAPNVSALLGPELSARMIAQAGGLERLARLPSSTVQVLGAERAFFEHLRGHAPPPRHGLLFLHPAIQSAPKGERGKLARALAGKVSIAARLDVGGAPIHPELAQSFDARRSVLKARRGAPRRPPRSRPSGLPLDRASRDR
jgi:nucleolar protein 56